MTLSERDQQHNWHPYTQHKLAKPAIAITKGEGALLWDEDGKEYIGCDCFLVGESLWTQQPIYSRRDP